MPKGKKERKEEKKKKKKKEHTSQARGVKEHNHPTSQQDGKKTKNQKTKNLEMNGKSEISKNSGPESQRVDRGSAPLNMR